MHGIACVDDIDDLLIVAVDQCHLSGVTQCQREHIVEVELVHLLLRPLLRRDEYLPASLHLRHAPFGWRRRLVLEEARHNVHIVVTQLTGRTPVGHASGRAIVNEHLQVLGSLLSSDVWR